MNFPVQSRRPGYVEVGPRTDWSKTIAGPQGTRINVNYVTPIHWEADGGLEDIDLTPVEQADGMLRIDRAPFKLIIDPTAMAIRYESRVRLGARIRVGLNAVGDQQTVSMSQLQPETVERALVRWAPVGGVKVELQVLRTGIRWVRTIEAPDAPHRFLWRYERTASMPEEVVRDRPAAIDDRGDEVRRQATRGPTIITDGWHKHTVDETFIPEVSRLAELKTRRRFWARDLQYPATIYG